MDLFQDIIDFHEKFGLEYNGGPRILPDDLAQYRMGFLGEELREYMDGWAIGDQEEMFDGLIDLVYVALGTAYLHGFDFNEGWNRVHEANMQKIRALKEEDSTRGSTYDVVKPEGWQPASLKDLVDESPNAMEIMEPEEEDEY